MLDWRALSQAPASLRLTLLLGFLIALVALGIDSTVPTLPALAHAFGTDAGAAQITLTGLFFGVACGQLVWGPFSDRLGRRAGLFAGLALVVAASLASVRAEGTTALAWLRFAQGFGLSCGPVIGRSIVRDLYSNEQAARLLSSMMIAFGLVPICAPIVGSTLLAGWGWQAVYWMHAVVAMALLAAVIRTLPETAPLARASPAPLAIASTFAALLRQREFLAPFLVLLGVQLGIIAFVTNSSLALIQGFGLTPFEYSLAFAGVMLGQITGALASARLVTRHGIHFMLRSGATLAAGAGITLAAMAWLGLRHWAAVVAPMAVYLFASSLVIPNATAAALSPFPRIAGSASSLMGSISFAIGAGLGAALGWLFDGSARPMATAIAMSATGAWLAMKLLRRGHAHG